MANPIKNENLIIERRSKTVITKPNQKIIIDRSHTYKKKGKDAERATDKFFTAVQKGIESIKSLPAQETAT